MSISSTMYVLHVHIFINYINYYKLHAEIQAQIRFNSPL